MAVPSQKELDFIASFARFNLSSDQDQKEILVETKIEPEPYHKEFHLFSNLLPEIRNQIWDLTLPAPRIILIRPIESPKDPNADPTSPAAVQYIASPCSYGGQHPIALSICRESRGQALRHLTERFHAYWDLNQDVGYLEVKRWGATKTMEAITDMRIKGLFEGFKKVATDIDIWHIQNPEPWSVLPFLDMVEILKNDADLTLN
jgi:hypothetical protein